MRLVVLYAAQIAFIVAGFSAMSAVFVELNSSAMNDVALELVDTSVSLVKQEAGRPFEQQTVQTLNLADVFLSSPSTMTNNPSNPQWGETAAMTSRPGYTPALTFGVEPGWMSMLAIQRNNPLVGFIFTTFAMPNNNSLWCYGGVGRADASNYFMFRPSLLNNEPGDPFQVTCNINIAVDLPRLPTTINYTSCFLWTKQCVKREYELGRDVQGSGFWNPPVIYVDPYGVAKANMYFIVPLQFAFDAAAGRDLATAVVVSSLDGVFLSNALKQSLPSYMLAALFDDRTGILMAWSLPTRVIDPSGKNYKALATSTLFDGAITHIGASVKCTGPTASYPATCPETPAPIVTDTYIYALRRVVSVNFRISVVIAADREHFFGAGERARAIGIAVGVVTCVVCLASSLVLWLTTVRPLRRLIGNMELASTFADLEEVDTNSFITEVEEANGAFLEMHGQLLAARPFIPQHVLGAFSRQRGEDFVDETTDERPSATHDDVDSVMGRSSNSKSHRSRHSRSTGKSQTVGKVADGIVVSLEPRVVAVLVANVSRFSTIVKSAAHDNLRKQYAEFLRIVSGAVHENKGVIDSVQGDHIIITFNSANRCGNSSAKAVRCAFDIRSRLDSCSEAVLPLSWREVTFGVALGHAVTGTLGTETMKFHATLTAAMRYALSMQRLARAAREVDIANGATPPDARFCFATDRVVADLTAVAHHRFEFAMSLPPQGRLVLVASITTAALATDDGTAAPPNEAPRADVDGEWLYTLAAIRNPHAAHNGQQLAAFRLLAAAPKAAAASVAAAKPFWDVVTHCAVGGVVELPAAVSSA